MIKCFLGPMFSGKTSAMLDEIDKANIAGLKTLVIKYAGDNRYCDSGENKIVTHSKREYNSGRIISTTDLLFIDQIVQKEDIKVIGIDEFQFLHYVSHVVDWAAQGRDVYISALDGDYKKDIFSNVSYILPYTDEVVKLKAVCMKCHTRNSAIFSERLGDEKELIVIGGDDKYIAVCRNCSTKNTRRK